MGLGQRKDVIMKQLVVNKGDIVRYIGIALPQYQNKLLEVKTVLAHELILLLPEEDKDYVFISGMGLWKNNSLLCQFSDIEQVEKEEFVKSKRQNIKEHQVKKLDISDLEKSNYWSPIDSLINN